MSAHNILQEANMAPVEICDPGTGVAMPVDRWNQHVPLTIAAAETNTLAAPTQAGQKLSIFAAVVTAGARVITAASAINATGNTVMTFNAVDEVVVLEAFPVGGGVYEWRVTFSAGVTLS